MKKFLTGLLAVVIVFMGTQTIFAEDPQPVDEDPTSQSTINFIENNEPTGPLNPENPDLPGTPELPGTGMAGPLSIDFVPNLPFGEQTITGKVETYETTNLKPYLQVTDTRGTGAGWEVTVTLGNFVGKTSGAVIPNAKLTFLNPEVKHTSANNSLAPSAVNPLAIISGGVGKPIFTAAQNQGAGTWLETWLTSNTKNEKIKLEVNTNYVRSEAYEATLNWSLNLAP